ncbi:MAG: hypothetical protein KAI71_00135 [Candidatus Pacebacteria bacterium]|nr:hypothetical protein [Candidatus Paceibacterota bacterium]
MIIQYILLLIGVGLLIGALLYSKGYESTKKEDKSAVITIIILLCILGAVCTSLTIHSLGSGTAHQSGPIPEWGISDGVYRAESDIIVCTESTELMVLLLPITEIQQNGMISDIPTYWSFPEENVVLPFEKGDIVEVRNGIIAESNFLEK